MVKREIASNLTGRLARIRASACAYLALLLSGVILIVGFLWNGNLPAIAAPGWGVGLSRIILHALCAFALSEIFARHFTDSRWAYRLACLLSIAVFLLTEGLRMSVGQAAWFTWRTNALCGLQDFFLALFGTSWGGWAATARRYGWYENNAPPSEEVVELVRAKHMAWIGAPLREPLGKRLFDLSLALIGLLISLPFWWLSAWVIWWQDPGPLLFVKNSVGKGGVNFRQFKLRTMVRGAEDQTGPVLSDEEDRRVLPFGNFLRKTALDELPQLINILLGEMSFVGPRPQRTVLVADYLQHMPQYAERHRVLPGLSGLAQVAGDYFLTPLQKLRFDRLYIQNRSARLDFQLLLLAFLITFWFRWQPGWNGRLPRRLLRLRRRRGG